jgi:RNA polymerase sigma factor (sigma-70 family)
MAIERQPLPGRPAADAVAPFPGIEVDAIAKAFDRHFERVYAFVARRADDRAVAEALTALAFRRALGGGRTGDPAIGFTGRVYRIAASAVVDRARRARRQIPSSIRATDLDERDDDQWVAEALSDEGATRAMAAAIDGELLRRAVLRVPDMHLHVLVVIYFDALEPDEIAAVLGCSTTEVALRLHRALWALHAAKGDPEGSAGEARLHVVGDAPDPGEASGSIIDADLLRLDTELRAAGRQAARTMHGRTQPTRWFSQELRARLLAADDSSAGDA